MKKNLLTLIGALLVISAATNPALANNNNTFSKYARVIGVEPVYRTVTIREPKRHCSYVTPQRAHNRHRQQRRHFVSGETYTGNRVSNGNRFRNNNQRNHQNRNQFQKNRHHGNHHGNQKVRHCVTTTVFREEHRLDGYHVTYVYRGNTFHTRTDYHPGDRIRVSVEVKPH